MAYTVKETAAEFWMLTQGILQDSKVDLDEARVINKWLHEHRRGTEFDLVIRKLEKFLEDGYIDRFESHDLIDLIGNVLRTLRTLPETEA